MNADQLNFYCIVCFLNVPGRRLQVEIEVMKPQIVLIFFKHIDSVYMSPFLLICVFYAVWRIVNWFSSYLNSPKVGVLQQFPKECIIKNVIALFPEMIIIKEEMKCFN